MPSLSAARFRAEAEADQGPYRKQGEVPMDITEIEVAKVREAEETKRQTAKLRAEAAKDRREKLADAWRASDSLGFAAIVMVVGMVATPCSIAIMYFAHLWFSK